MSSFTVDFFVFSCIIVSMIKTKLLLTSLINILAMFCVFSPLHGMYSSNIIFSKNLSNFAHECFAVMSEENYKIRGKINEEIVFITEEEIPDSVIQRTVVLSDKIDRDGKIIYLNTNTMDYSLNTLTHTTRNDLLIPSANVFIFVVTVLILIFILTFAIVKTVRILREEGNIYAPKKTTASKGGYFTSKRIIEDIYGKKED